MALFPEVAAENARTFKKQMLEIKSSNRQEGEHPSDFTLHLAKSITIYSHRLLFFSITCPLTITQDDRSIIFSEDGVFATATIDYALWNTTDIDTRFTTALNAASPTGRTYTITYLTTPTLRTNIAVDAGAAVVKIHWGSCPLVAKKFGFDHTLSEETIPGAGSITGVKGPSFFPMFYKLIVSEFGTPCTNTAGTSVWTASIAAPAHGSDNSDDTTISYYFPYSYHARTPIYHVINTPITTSVLHVTLRMNSGQRVETGEAEWLAIFEIEYE